MGDLTFATQGTADIWEGKSTKSARQTLPRQLWSTAQRKLDQFRAAESLEDLRSPPKNCLHPLDRDRKGQYSIKINDQYRICFLWTEQGARSVEICDYH